MAKENSKFDWRMWKSSSSLVAGAVFATQKITYVTFPNNERVAQYTQYGLIRNTLIRNDWLSFKKNKKL